jgi:hypothetical protein
MSSNKIGSLQKCELHLRRALAQDSEPDKLARVAEKVRAAQLGVLKKMEREIPPTKLDEEAEKERMANIRRERLRWQSMRSTDIISQYK